MFNDQRIKITQNKCYLQLPQLGCHHQQKLRLSQRMMRQPKLVTGPEGHDFGA